MRTSAAATCGNGQVEDGETCDDGNTSNDDECPSDCRIAACSPVPGSDRVVEVTYTPPFGEEAAGMRVLIDYPEGMVGVPSTDGSVPSGIVTDAPSGTLVVARDLRHALRVVVARGSNIPAGRLFRVHFTACRDALAPGGHDFSCSIGDASDENGAEVAGADCTIVP